MFNNLDPKNKDIDDIFADTDNAPAPAAPANPNIPRPAVAPMPSAVKTPMPSASDLEMEEGGSKPKMVRVLKKLFIFIAVVALVGAAAYFIYIKLLINNVNDLQDETATPNVNIPITPIVETPIIPTTTITTSTEATSTLATSTAIDTDTDGLSDTEEQVLGTNPIMADTDGDLLTDGDEIKKHLTSPLLKDTDADGLNDGEEINTHKTDPNNPDTDGDTYKDGDEVKAGYNPLQKPIK